MAVVGVADEVFLDFLEDAQPLGDHVVVVLFVLHGLAQVVDAGIHLDHALLEELLVLGADLLLDEPLQ